MSKKKNPPASAKRQADKAIRPDQRTTSEKKRTISKKASCISLLESANGATISDLQKATGWQPHSIRGFLAGTAKKLPGATLSSTKDPNKPRRYRLCRVGAPGR
jgi:hypothetical protein